jgi:hypothetical protein
LRRRKGVPDFVPIKANPGWWKPDIGHQGTAVLSNSFKKRPGAKKRRQIGWNRGYNSRPYAKHCIGARVFVWNFNTMKAEEFFNGKNLVKVIEPYGGVRYEYTRNDSYIAEALVRSWLHSHAGI